MLDLNTLIPAGSNLQLIDAYNINDRGEILVDAIPLGIPPVQTGQLGHLALLVPCHPSNEQDCSAVTANATQTNAALSSSESSASTQRHLTSMQPVASWRTRLAQRTYLPGAATAKD